MLFGYALCIPLSVSAQDRGDDSSKTEFWTRKKKAEE